MASIRLDRLTIKDAGGLGTAFVGVFTIYRERHDAVEFPVTTFLPRSEEGEGVAALWAEMRRTMVDLNELAVKTGPGANQG